MISWHCLTKSQRSACRCGTWNAFSSYSCSNSSCVNDVETDKHHIRRLLKERVLKALTFLEDSPAEGPKHFATVRQSYVMKLNESSKEPRGTWELWEGGLAASISHSVLFIQPLQVPLPFGTDAQQPELIVIPRIWHAGSAVSWFISPWKHREVDNKAASHCYNRYIVKHSILISGFDSNTILWGTR